MVAIVWFRNDLRLADQPALAAAASSGPVLPVFVDDRQSPGVRAEGAAARWWRVRSLAALDADLARRGGRLLVLKGPAAPVLRALVQRVGATAIHATAQPEPWWGPIEAELGPSLVRHPGSWLHPPGAVVTAAGAPFRVFTPFARAHEGLGPPPRPRPAPARIAFAPPPEPAPPLPRFNPRWARGFAEAGWTPGEEGARRRLAEFLPRAAAYGRRRDFPAEPATSRLSPHLHFGEISAAAVWHAVVDAIGAQTAQPFTRQLIWRDFARELIRQHPDSAERPHRPAFARMAWTDVATEPGRSWLAAWRQGRTGYPLVDAGMRELWQTGWMHNRVRMVVGSFLVKHLGIDWREGERWFWDTLLDADLPNNAMGWQWVTGSGVDGQPFHRIFSPVLQAERFDALAYIRRFAPEYDGVAPVRPIVDHAEARARALARLAALREDAAP
ncbi:MAG: DNA photolyase family protein [Sphingomonadaceae bacterium]|uniref:cryptochrome/photolyase family protein n=1 Tax=Thermaurantiacus sp. TaxID=2820283 RepID=UPI00298F0E55|nr:deoxyribodipyrimidine photo-lyase [Thermaurantiacus sp.]MCS6986278.1 DNA photolyase family protein [Sphingomonadaceae bacterium]MDW8415727.1 deoxyribodipyrimidine photo-lyase [Thermaurantiacus sp.]